MKAFIINCIVFLFSCIGVLSIGLLLPNNSPARSIDYSILAKHELLADQHQKNRIILTGGSNVVFGFDSQIISSQVQKPVINHGIHAGYGMKYILDDLKAFVRKGDTVVLSPEYYHFLNKNYLGREPLLFSLTAKPSNIKLLSIGQCIEVAPYVPKFAFQRVKSFAYNILKAGSFDSSTPNVYGEFAINKYGDNHTHWDMENEEFHSYVFSGALNDNAFQYVLDFQNEMEKRGARLIVVYPSLCESSFEKNENYIKDIDTKLREYGVNVLGHPEDFSYSDDLFFDSPYHLNGTGVIQRSKKLSTFLE